MYKTEQDLSVKVVTDFKEFRPSFDCKSTVERLLGLTSPKYLSGLDRVVLRDGAEVPRRQMLRERKIGKSLGYYHRRTPERRAWIEMYVDRILDGEPPILLRMKWLRELSLGGTLFHEIGHHIDAQIEPHHGDRERVANQWKKKLFREYGSRRFAHLRFLRPNRPPVRWFFVATVYSLRWLSARMKKRAN